MNYHNHKKKNDKIILKAYNILERFDFKTNCEKYLNVIEEFI